MRLSATLNSLFAALVLALASVPSRGAASQESALSPRIESFLSSYGERYGLKAGPQGQLLYVHPDFESGASKSETLAPSVSQRLSLFLSSLPAGKEETAMAAALRMYLKDRPVGDLEARLFAQGEGGEVLTELGRNMLMDILTAEDGRTFSSKAPVAPAPGKGLRSLQDLKASGLFKLGSPGLEASLGALFDAASAGDPGALAPGLPGASYRVGQFQWAALSKPGEKSLEGYSVDPAKQTVRVMVSARRSVRSDRLLVQDPSEAAAIYAETGLDEKLLESHGAKVVRAIDNLVTMDVPLAEVGELGQTLQLRGIESRPARVVQMIGGAAVGVVSNPFFGTLPFSRGLAAAAGRAASAASPSEVRPMNAGARDLMKINALNGAGMTGKGAIVGIIDSGLDLSHPDFKDRVAAYIDLTGDGLKDTVAHGTHVAGSVGGSGAASGGLYKGMAPDAKFVVVKVFGKTGSTSEDTILAAMAAVRNLPQEIRPQVVNMSLGGPGDPDKDPLGVMANEMMVKDNIVMAIAAGNSGPSKETIGSPGNARFVMTVTGVNHDGNFSFFPSRGPVSASGGGWNKPDISTVAGDVNMNQQRKAFWQRIFSPASGAEGQAPAKPSADGAVPADSSCIYGPGVISSRSSEDEDTACAVKGNDKYRFMSGTSMATPMAAGIAADVVGYLREHGRAYQATEVKALLMETADDLHQAPEVQGAGLVNGEKLARTLEERVAKGLPIGNLALMLAKRGTSRWDEFNMKLAGRYQRTELGLLDTKTGHLVNSDEGLREVLDETHATYKQLPLTQRVVRHFRFWFDS